MKGSFVALAGAFLISGTAMAAQTTATIKVSGWHCESCSGKTVAAVKQVKGVKDASADPTAKTLTVTFEDSEVKQAQIERTIMELHYKIDR